ncbi:mitotic checkpoint regulator, MAD2B-interacting-domain-containing protein [Clohesyomyces aquaticus]|uniref:Mitotic checkpoint regulator, MAD2B-interacting-domain-containing protein n=1 Tax=Clohesyomyces aquaticus TaxID=1231657 RepID=A0A1Y1Z593_9PLEO|nr:mitotic checkpoint regulator, MAD2B-interacting-domain-containing protein [Clohesyomyces aquaticus]
MNLIAYSDSEESDNDAPPAPHPAAKPTAPPKSTFQKVVSKPGTIKLNLPAPSKAGAPASRDDIDADAPPAKKARIGGGFGGFNAMLPAPKKAAATANANANATATATATTSTAPAFPADETKEEATEDDPERPSSRFLAAKASKPSFNFMKTGAEPMFRRQPTGPDYDDEGNPIQKPEPSAQSVVEASLQAKKAVKEHNPEVRFAGRKFMPMSAARKNKGKRPVPYSSTPAPAAKKPAVPDPRPQAAVETKPAKKKISLFSAAGEDDSGAAETPSSAEYQPLLYGAEEDDDKMPEETLHSAEAHPDNITHLPASTMGAPAGPQHLTDIAAELHLSEAERRQLFGRRGRGEIPDSVNLVEFNTDKEYAHNEELRAQGETVQHNALKSISGTGKNSLRSLINVAATQKDALEEHFAQGRRNKREAGSKYGW